MSTKLLNVLGDENPDLHRQFGCMSGLLQMFDRRHLLTGRHGGQTHHKKLLSGNLGAESHGQITLEKNLSRNANENQRMSIESSTSSFSSSSGSTSFSSLECNKSTQHEHFPVQRSTFQETSSKNLHQNIDSRRDRSFNILVNASARSSRESLDFRDVVKDSIYRDSPRVSTETACVVEIKKNVMKHVDSPRPVLPSNSMNGSYVVGKIGKPRMPLELDESLKLLATIKDSSWHFSESKEDSLFSIKRESPRFSCDSNAKSITKPQELPRLSLDSREHAIRVSSSDLNQRSVLKNLERSHEDQRISRASALQKDFAGCKQPQSLVAKLMGLEAMPDLSCDSPARQGLMRSASCKDVTENQRNNRCFSNPPKVAKDSKQNYHSSTVRSNKDSVATQKMTSNSWFPVETAPWRRQEKDNSSQKMSFGCKEAPSRSIHESVYCEIDKKLEELEFLQSNKDFRALKQILDSIQAKRIAEVKKSKDQQQGFITKKTCTCESPTGYDKSRTACRQSKRFVESPIVIMKPAKSLQSCGITPSTVIPLEGLAGLQKVRIGHSTDAKTASGGNRVVKGRTPKGSPKVALDHLHTSRNKKSNSVMDDSSPKGHHMQKLQGLSSPRASLNENFGSSLRTSNSLSPRMEQKKHKLEKKSHSLVPFSDWEKPRRPSKQPSETVSPRGRLRMKPKSVQQNDDNLNEIGRDSRSLSRQADEVSICSDASLASLVDIEVTTINRSANLNMTSSQRKNVDNVASTKESKESLMNLREGGSSAMLEPNNLEQPSPISVLHASFYKDDSPPSPANEASCLFKDRETEGIGGPSFKILPFNPSTEDNLKKFKNIEVLVQKLGQLNFSDEESAASEHIAGLGDTQDPNHRYISEILLASGLLFQDIRLHQSGHAINPDLFPVLEQRMNEPIKPGSACGNIDTPKCNPEKIHRKLVFDTVNELLAHKLEPRSPSFHPMCPMTSSKLLLHELYSEIAQLQADALQGGISSDEDNDGLKLILSRDVMRQSQGWTSLGGEVSGLVLDIERSIFKDLVDEVIESESVVMHAKSIRQCRQLLFT